MILFKNNFSEDVLSPMKNFLSSLKSAQRVKQFQKSAQKIYEDLAAFIAKMDKVYYGEHLLSPVISSEEQPKEEHTTSTKITKPQKGGSAKASLEMFQNGQTITEIAQNRNLATSTIFSHLCQFIPTGEISVYNLVEKSVVERLMEKLPKLHVENSLTAIREQVGEEFSFYEIRAVLAFLSMGDQ